MKTKPPFPEWFDNTKLSAFRTCETLYYWEHQRKLTLKGGNINLHAGACFASGLEAARRAFYVEGQDAESSVQHGITTLIREFGNFEVPENSPKSWDAMAGAMAYYFDIFPFGEDPITPLVIGDQHTIEFSFACPLPINHPTTGNPILFTGRADMIGEYNGAHFVVDEKTTKQLGAKWANQWKMSSQFAGYAWAAQSFNHKVIGAIIRGIAIRKTGYDHAEAIVYHPQWVLDRWLKQTVKTIERIIYAWENDDWQLSLGSACANYGGCGMMQLCESAKPENWIDTYYETRDWNPLDKKEKK